MGEDIEGKKELHLCTLLEDLVRKDDIEGLKRVFASQTCQSWKAEISYVDYALAFAVLGNHIEVLKFLITDYKADVNHTNGALIEPPLWSAIEKKDESMVKFLIHEAKADPHVIDNEGVTAIMMAASNGLVDTVRMLALDVSVDLCVRDNKGCNVVYYALQGGNVSVLSFLVDEMGLRIRDKYGGRGVLHVAAELGHVEVTRWLVEEKSAENELTWYDRTPLHYAASGGHLGILEYYILERGVSVESKDYSRRTVLHYVAGKGHLALVQWLVEVAGADINARDVIDFQPQDLVAKAGLGDMVKYFQWVRATREVRFLSAFRPILIVASQSSGND